MKTTYGTILVLAMATAILLLTALPCRAVEDEEPEQKHRQFELTDEMIERMMSRLAETNPEKAEELERLRGKDPEKFRVEFKKIMREQLVRRARDQREREAGREFRQWEPARADVPFVGRGRAGREHGAPGIGYGRGRGGMRLRERHMELLEWLEKNFPEKAKKLAELKEENPQLYMRQMAASLKKYGRIIEAEKENPELAEVLKENLELSEKRNSLLRKIKATKGKDEKEKLTEELKEVISSKFDLLVKRKQIAYEQLLKKLEELKKEIKESKAGVEKWKSAEFKSENVKKRLEELLSRNRKFKWD